MNFLKRMSIKNRFYCLLIFLLFILITAGIFIVVQTRQLSEITSIMHNHPLEVSNAALKSNGEIIKIHRSMKDVVLSENKIELHAAVQKIIENEAETYRNLDLIKNRILEEEGKALEHEAREIFEVWKPIRDEVIAYE